MKPGNFRLRKATDINQEHAIYEIVDEEQTVLFDITKTDTGAYQACIADNDGQGRAVDLSVLLALIQDACRKLEADD